MKWTVKEWLTEGYQARKAGALTAYIYRALKWPDFYNRDEQRDNFRAFSSIVADHGLQPRTRTRGFAKLRALIRPWIYLNLNS